MVRWLFAAQLSTVAFARACQGGGGPEEVEVDPMDLADANQTWEYTSNEGETLTLAANMQGEVEGEGFLLADGWWIAVNYEGTIRRTSPYTFQVKVLDQHAETAPGDEGGVTWAPQLDATFNCDYTWHDDTMTPSLDCFSTSSDQAFVFEGAAG